MAEKKTTRGRKKETTKAEQIGPDLKEQMSDEDRAEFNKDMVVMQQHEQHLIDVDERFGDSLPYDRGRVEDEARFFLTQSASAMLEAGRRLLQLKEHEKHGDYLSALERIGIAPRAAQKFIQAAVKFSGPNAPTLAHLGKAKLLELMLEDEEELEALADGGTIAGLDLDEVDKMSVRELRATLRKEREKRTREKEADEKLLASKDNKINEFERRQRLAPTWQDYSFEVTTQAGAAITKASIEIQSVGTIFADLRDKQMELSLPDEEMQQIAANITARLDDLREIVQDMETEYYAALSFHYQQFAAQGEEQ